MYKDKNYNEQDILLNLIKGDEEAFTIIYNQYWKKLYFLAHKHLKSQQAAEEIVQEVFMDIWRKRATIQIHSLPLYLAAVTRYMVYRQLAKNNSITQVHIDDHHPHLIVQQQKALENKLLLEIIEKLSNTLPEKCRLVFINTKLLDQPLPQVAAAMDISVKTAEAHLTKALKVIKGNLKGGFSVLFLF